MQSSLVQILVWAALLCSVPCQEVNRLHDVLWLLDAASVPMMRFSVLTAPVLVGAAGESASRAIWGEDEEREQPISPDRLVQMVVTQFGFDSERDGRGQAVQYADGFLAVRAPEEGQQKVAAFLEFMERHMLQPIRIELYVLPPESGRSLSRAVLTAAEAEQTLRATPVGPMVTAIARMGQSELLEAVARQSVLTDYDVEVAQETKAYDPLVQVLLTGLSAVVRVDPVAGDRHLVAFRGRFSELDGPIPTREIEPDGVGNIQLPRVWWSSAIATAVIEDGGALILGNSATPGGLWLVRVRRLARELDDGAPFGAAFVPAAALLRAPERETSRGFIHPSPSGSGLGSILESLETEQTEPIGLDLFRTRLASEAPRPSGNERVGEFHLVGGSLFVRGGDAYRTRAAELAQEIGRTLTRVVTVECRLGAIGGEEAARLASGALDPSALAGRIEATLITPCFAGDRFLLLGGKEVLYLKDKDVEIAQGITVYDPITDFVFAGFTLNGSATPISQDRFAFQANLNYQELAAAPEGFTTRFEDVGTIDLARIVAVRTRSAPIVRAGEWTVFHTSPLHATEKHLVVLVRVTG